MTRATFDIEKKTFEIQTWYHTKVSYWI